MVIVLPTFYRLLSRLLLHTKLISWHLLSTIGGYNPPCVLVVCRTPFRKKRSINNCPTGAAHPLLRNFLNNNSSSGSKVVCCRCMRTQKNGPLKSQQRIHAHVEYYHPCLFSLVRRVACTILLFGIMHTNTSSRLQCARWRAHMPVLFFWLFSFCVPRR